MEVILLENILKLGKIGDKVEVKNVGNFERGLIAHLRSKHSELLADITENDRKVSGVLEDNIKAAIDSFASGFSDGHQDCS